MRYTSIARNDGTANKQNRTVFARINAQKRRDTVHLPVKRRQMISLEETMIHDLFLMSATPCQQADMRRKFNHRTLTFEEMAASGNRRERNKKQRTNRPKGFLAALVEGMSRT